VAQLRCHYCDFITPLPPTCPHCSSAELTLEGVGTQRVEEALVEQFPNIRVIRMDVDTTGWKGAHDHLVESFRRREADVLLGTQMVAKGLDFPAVTLVGVISADTGLHMPDFRASERSFQLLTQVAGRSGRGTTPGEVVIQTMLPTDPVLQAASRQDFSAFVENELAERRAAAFPPFGRLILFRWRGKDEKAVIAAAQQGIARLRHAVPPDQTILGPAPAPLTRLREFYRYQALLSGPTAQAIHRSAASRLHTMRAMALSQSVMLQINVDPLSIM
jgi:primosomal protein N' (replication factor Y)